MLPLKHPPTFIIITMNYQLPSMLIIAVDYSSCRKSAVQGSEDKCTALWVGTSLKVECAAPVYFKQDGATLRCSFITFNMTGGLISALGAGWDMKNR